MLFVLSMYSIALCHNSICFSGEAYILGGKGRSFSVVKGPFDHRRRTFAEYPPGSRPVDSPPFLQRA